jgi:oligopeptide transport system substrate-binding protein
MRGTISVAFKQHVYSPDAVFTLAVSHPRLPHQSAMTSLVRWAFLLTALSLLHGCGRESGSVHPTEVALRRGLGGEPASLDPSAATDSFSVEVVQDLYEGLLREGPDGKIIPAVASSWSVDKQGTRYTFELRSDARWSNGQPVRAKDFVAAWQRVVDPKVGSPVSNNLRLIEGAAAIISGRSSPTTLGVIATSDNELIIQLDQPAPYFPQLLAHSSTFPVFSDGAARSHNASTWVSNGAYVLSEWRPGTRLDLVKNEMYWDSANVQIAKVQYLIATDQYAQFAQYRAGQLDITDTIPTNALADLRAEHPMEVVIAPYSAVAYYGLNMTAPPLAGNLKLRQALSMSINRQRLVEALAAGQVAAFAIVPPGIWNYDPIPLGWRDLPDSERIAEAKRLYKEAGYSTAEPLHLRLLLNSNPSIRQTATLIAAMWKEDLGVDTSLTDEEFKVFLQSRRDKKRWDVLRLAWNADYNDASNFLDIFRSGSANNDTGYANPAFDAILNTAGTTSDADARREVLQTAEKMLLADHATIPLYFFVSKHLVKPYVVGFKPNPFDRIRSQSLTIATH